jgi:hypothetical protein
MLLFAAGFIWIAITRIVIIADFFFSAYSNALVFPANLAFMVGFIWLWSVTRKYYAPGGSRSTSEE